MANDEGNIADGPAREAEQADHTNTAEQPSTGKAQGDEVPPIYESVRITTGFDPQAALVLPITPKFSIYGQKRRTELARATSQVLRDAGFSSKLRATQRAARA